MWSRTRTQSVPWCMWQAKHFSECLRFFVFCTPSSYDRLSEVSVVMCCVLQKPDHSFAVHQSPCNQDLPQEQQNCGQAMRSCGNFWAATEELASVKRNSRLQITKSVTWLGMSLGVTDSILALSDLMENSVKSVKLCGTTGAMCVHETLNPILCLSHL